jgi:hypothetical protein
MQIIMTFLVSLIVPIILELCWDDETYKYYKEIEYTEYERMLNSLKNDKPTVFIHKHDVNINISKK